MLLLSLLLTSLFHSSLYELLRVGRVKIFDVIQRFYILPWILKGLRVFYKSPTLFHAKFKLQSLPFTQSLPACIVVAVALIFSHKRFSSTMAATPVTVNPPSIEVPAAAGNCSLELTNSAAEVACFLC